MNDCKFLAKCELVNKELKTQTVNNVWKTVAKKHDPNSDDVNVFKSRLKKKYIDAKAALPNEIFDLLGKITSLESLPKEIVNGNNEKMKLDIEITRLSETQASAFINIEFSHNAQKYSFCFLDKKWNTKFLFESGKEIKASYPFDPSYTNRDAMTQEFLKALNMFKSKNDS